MPDHAITVDDLPDPFKATVRETIGTARVVDVVRYDDSLLDLGGDTYRVHALVGGWLVDLRYTEGQPSSETSAVRVADLRKVDITATGATVTMDDPVDGTVSWGIPDSAARALIRESGKDEPQGASPPSIVPRRIR